MNTNVWCRFRTASVALVLIAFASTNAGALPIYTPRDSSSFQGTATQFEGDFVPTTQGSGGTGDPSGWSSDGNILTMDYSSAANETWFTTAGFAADPDIGYTMEMRFQVSDAGTNYVGEFNPQGSTPGTLFAFAIKGDGIYDTLRGPNVQLYAGDLTDGFHTMRVAVAGNTDVENGPGDHAYLYIDGVLTGSGWTSPNPYALNYNGPTRMLFGDTGGGITDGTLLVDYLRMDTTGPFAPIPEPSSMLLFGIALIASCGVARRRKTTGPATCRGSISTFAIAGLPAVAFAILSSSAMALPNYAQRDSSAFQGVTPYEGDAIPQTMGTGGTGDTSEWTTDGDVLTMINSTIVAETWWLGEGFSPNADVGYTMEIRFKVTDAGTRYLGDFNMQASSPGSLFGVAIAADGVYDSLRFPINPVLYEGDFTDDFHTMRVAVAGNADVENGPGDHAYLYVDGVAIGEGFTSSDDYSPNYGGPVRTLFGDTGGGSIDGTILIDYVRYDDTGPYAPVSESPILLGDYSQNGVVDAADYTIWRDRFGQSSLPNEGASLGTVDGEDYTFWKSQFGNSLPGGGGVAAVVPEPATLFSLIVGVLLIGVLGARSRTAWATVPFSCLRVPQYFIEV